MGTMLLPAILITASAWIALAVNIFTNLILLRAARSLSIVRSLLLSFLVGLLSFVALTWLAWKYSPHDAFVPRSAAALLTYLCVSYFFFHIVHIPEASVRLRVLQELAAGRPLTQSDILRRYNAASILDIRLERLMRNGQLVADSGRLFTGRKRMLYVASVFALAKRILLGKKS